MTEPHSGDPVSEHPNPEDIAAYLNGRLAPEAAAALEEHLLDCRECRQLVTSTRQLLRSQGRPRKLAWSLSIAAAAVLAIGLLARAPAPAPDDAKTLRAPDALSAEALPRIPIISPVDGGVVGEDSLVFRWRSQPDRPLYRLVIMETGGREVWSAETADTTLALPIQVSLERGHTYFWTVDALGADGRTRTTRTKQFSTAP
jgi:hypothetical protein